MMFFCDSFFKKMIKSLFLNYLFVSQRYFGMAQKKGKQLSIRIPHELHISLEFSADVRNISLNELINQRLSGSFTKDEQNDAFDFKHRFFQLRDIVEFRSDLTNELFRTVIKQLDDLEEKNCILTDKLEGALMDNYRLLHIIYNEINLKKKLDN